MNSVTYIVIPIISRRQHVLYDEKHIAHTVRRNWAVNGSCVGEFSPALR